MRAFVPPDVILDANALSDVTNGRAEVVDRFYRYLRDHERVPVAAPALFEVLEGLTRKPKPTRSDALRNLRSVLDVRPFGAREAEVAGDIAGTLNRQGKTVGMVDPQIAAVAVTNGLTLVTSNLRHFQPIRDIYSYLRLTSWRDRVVAP